MTKLSESAVPIPVARARGYRVLPLQETGGDARKATKAEGFNARLSQTRRLEEALLEGEVLLMPWYLAGQPDRVAAHQFRPDSPGTDQTGRPVKYEFVSGEGTPLGQHPSMPVAWLADTAIPLVVAEGLIKADALLGAWLGANHALPSPDSEDPSTALTTAMESVPKKDRVAILSIAGAGNWARNPEWAGVSLGGRTVWLCFDADAASNPNVRKQALSLATFLTRKGASVSHILVPALDGDGKTGVDDWIAAGHTWDEIESLTVSELPEVAMEGGAVFDDVGQYRIAADGCALEYCEPIRSQDGSCHGGSWRTRWMVNGLPKEVSFGGKIVAFRETRYPTAQETRTGVLSTRVNADESVQREVEIEVTWKDLAGYPQTETITGAPEMLTVVPAKWGSMRALGIHIPDRALQALDWPDGPSGQGWLAAVKKNRADETRHDVVWLRDGWIPAPPGQVPAFMVGPSQVGGGGSILSGVKPSVANWERFGVDADMSWESASDRKRIRHDLQAVVESILHSYVELGAAAALLLGSLRPIVPWRPRTSLCFVGPPGKGKSFSAGVLMGFWSAKPGAFWKDSLPGAAQDSMPVTLRACSSALTWVLDDLAPSSSAHKSTTERAAMEQLVRSVYNGNGVGRANPDGTPRQPRPPWTFLCVTEENESFVESITDRVLPVRMGQGSLPESRKPTDELKKLCCVDGAPSRVAGAAVLLMQRMSQLPDADDMTTPLWGHGPDSVLPWAGKVGWERMVAKWEALAHQDEKEMGEYLQRHGFPLNEIGHAPEKLADITLAWHLWAQMMANADCDPLTWDLGFTLSEEEIQHRIEEEGLSRSAAACVVLCERLAKQVAVMTLPDQVERTRMTPGHVFLTVLRLMLGSGKAHVLRRGDLKSAPGRGDEGAVLLGWTPRGDDFAPAGDQVGWWVAGDHFVDDMVVVSSQSVVRLARLLYPDMVPEGTATRQLVDSVKSENLLAPGTRVNSKTGQRYVIVDGEATFGVPILCSTLWDDTVTEPRPTQDAIIAYPIGDETRPLHSEEDLWK